MNATNPHHDDLVAMAEEAGEEIAAAELLQRAVDPSGGAGDHATGGVVIDAADSLATLELGYYEAELRSLRGAATTLDLGPSRGVS
ncbi:hypothetical protein [Pedococcus bigeumensis]|uniref:hypothetical protein n=1 Tax=Pedococcus bigeumensis TaxID=433644 RepID=UPI002FEC8C56